MSKKVIDVGKIYFIKDNNNTKMCSDIKIDNRHNTLWFSLKNEDAKYFCERADAFVMAILPIAMTRGYDVICHDLMSKKLHYQLNHYLIPILNDETEIYNKMSIYADLTDKVETENAVMTSFTGGVDSLYTIMKHGKESDFPIKYLCLFNLKSYYMYIEKRDEKENFYKQCERVEEFARQYNYEKIYLDTNLDECLSEYFSTVVTFRNIACVLSIQKLVGTYLLSSSRKATQFEIDPYISEAFDLLIVPLASTESLTFYLSGAEKTRIEKIKELTEYDISYKWLHPCARRGLDEKNCGHCSKCLRDLATLWYFGELDKYKEVFDIDKYKKNLNQNLAYAIVNTKGILDKDVSDLLLSSKSLPDEAKKYSKYFKTAIKNLEEYKNDKKDDKE